MMNGCKNSTEMMMEKISPKMREVISIAADHCPVRTLLEVRGSCYPTQCDVQKALSCFSIPTESDIMSGQTCRWVTQTVSVSLTYVQWSLDNPDVIKPDVINPDAINLDASPCGRFFGGTKCMNTSHT
jgi:hypothetical protein